MAYLKPVPTRTCGDRYCQRPATQILCNRYNEEVNYFCRRHGNAEMKALSESEAREPHREVWPAR